MVMRRHEKTGHGLKISSVCKDSNVQHADQSSSNVTFETPDPKLETPDPNLC